jgi:hypothetical protein
VSDFEVIPFNIVHASVKPGVLEFDLGLLEQAVRNMDLAIRESSAVSRRKVGISTESYLEGRDVSHSGLQDKSRGSANAVRGVLQRLCCGKFPHDLPSHQIREP